MEGININKNECFIEGYKKGWKAAVHTYISDEMIEKLKILDNIEKENDIIEKNTMN